MENPEKELISNNIDKLVESTRCSTLFLKVFQAERILSKEDLDSIDVEDRVVGPLGAASKFYEILVTRKRSFELLIKALEKTCQTGALDILLPERHLHSSHNETLHILQQERYPRSSQTEILHILEQEGHHRSAQTETLHILPQEQHALVCQTAQQAVEPTSCPRQLTPRTMMYKEHPRFIDVYNKSSPTAVIIVSCECFATTIERIKQTTRKCGVFENFHEYMSRRAIFQGIPVVKCHSNLPETLGLVSKTKTKCILLTAHTLDDNMDINSFKQKFNYFNCNFVEDSLTWEDLSEAHQNEILNEIEIVLNLSKDEISETLKTLDNSTMIQLVNVRIPLILKDSIPDNLKIYISRTLVGRKFLNAEFIMSECVDIFVFKDVTTAFQQKIDSKFNLVSSTFFLESTRGLFSRYILLDQVEHFYYICERYNSKNVHLLGFDGDQLVWIRSRGELDIIQRSLISTQPTINEADFLKSLLEYEINEVTNPHNLILISDSPGKGKSVLLRNIAQYLNQFYGNNCSNKFVAFAVISELVSAFKLLTSNKDKPVYDKNIPMLDKDVEISICKCICTNELSMVYLQKNKCLLKELLLDGFDELDYQDEELGYEYIKLLATIFSDTRIWITTRPHMLWKLENKLNVMGYGIQAFNENDQIEFLTRLWSRDTLFDEDLTKQKLVYFASQCLQEIKAKFDGKEEDIAGIPLQCFLIGEVFQNVAYEYLTLGDNQKESFVKQICISDMFDLYEKLVATKFSTFHDFYNDICQNLSNGYNLLSCLSLTFPFFPPPLKTQTITQKELQNAHIYFSLLLFDPSLAEQLELTLFPRNLPDKLVVNVGLLEAQNLSEPTFIHRTLAEYFFALFVIEVFSKNCIKSLENVRRKVLMYILKTDDSKIHIQNGFVACSEFKHDVVCYFINALLGKPYTNIEFGELIFKTEPNITLKLAKACAAANYSNIFVSIFTESILSKLQLKKEFAEELLYISVFRGCGQMLKVCSELEIFQDVQMTELRKGDYTLLHFAVQGGDFQTIEHLCEKENFDAVLRREGDNFRDLLHICVSDTKKNDERGLQKRKRILNYLVKKNATLLRGINHKDQNILQIDSVHLSLQEEFIYLVVNLDKKLFINLLHSMFKVLCTEKYINFAEASFRNKRESFVIKSVNSIQNGFPLVHSIVDSIEPKKKLIKLFKSYKVDYGIKVENVSIFERAVKRKRRGKCLEWILDNVILCQEDFVNSIENLFNFYDVDVIKRVISIIYHKRRITYLYNNTILHILLGNRAIENQKMIDVIQFLIDEVIDVNITNNKNETPLHILAVNPNFSREIWKLLVDNSADIFALDKNNQSPLQKIFQMDSLFYDSSSCNQALKSLNLLKRLPDSDSKGNCALHYAAQISNFNLFKVIVELCPKVDVKNNNRETPLHISIRPNHFSLECWKFLISKDANVLAKDVNSETPVFKLGRLNIENQAEAMLYVLSEFRGKSSDKFHKIMWELISSFKIDSVKEICQWCNSDYRQGMKTIRIVNTGTFLDAALKNPDAQMFFYIFKNFGCREISVLPPPSCIHKLVSTKENFLDSLKLVQIICKRYPHLVNSKNDQGRYTLSTKYINPQFINHLVTLGANVDKQDANGNAPLHWAILNSSPDLEQLLMGLVECGANVNAENFNKETTLLLLTQLRDEHLMCTCFLYLLSVPKISLDKVYHSGNTILHLFLSRYLNDESNNESNNKHDIFNNSLNHKPKFNSSSLFHEIVKRYVRKGCSVLLRQINDDGLTPIQIYQQKFTLEERTTQLLMEYQIVVAKKT